MIEVFVDGPVGTIRLNRPKQLNALIGGMREELLAGIQRLVDDSEVRVLVLTGQGRGFCAGGDLDRLLELRRAGDSAELSRLLGWGHQVITALIDSPKPVLASINGATAGAGLALALACDLRLAAASAVFSTAFVHIGLVPDWGTTWLLPRAVGEPRALELALTGRKFGADEALALGLVHRVVEDPDLASATRNLAEQLANAPSLAVRGIKQLIRSSTGTTLTQQMRDESHTQVECFAQPEVLARLEARAKAREAK